MYLTFSGIKPERV